MFVRLQVASRRPQALLAKSIAAWRAASLQVEVEGASSEVEVLAHAGEASKSIDQLS
jgi:hypothetical protein